ncbi:DUF5798 family protein [Halobacterium zhouii]|uniref:DUF5798 family protein n=1 Tax=Halobacterium zhouii TaxID=2902624 RepID=UPI001E3398DE|nr:DUF5798 family protein [Halobacterium zhouii]
MGFGSTAKKLQKITDVADTLQDRFERLREQVNELSDTVEDTSERVEGMESKLAEQRQLLEAIAESEDVDVESVVSDDTGDGDTATGTTPTAESGDGND